jgi:hypothetical protein
MAVNPTAVTVGLGWDVRTTTGTDFDLDVSALAVNDVGKVTDDRNSAEMACRSATATNSRAKCSVVCGRGEPAVTVAADRGRPARRAAARPSAAGQLAARASAWRPTVLLALATCCLAPV